MPAIFCCLVLFCAILTHVVQLRFVSCLRVGMSQSQLSSQMRNLISLFRSSLARCGFRGHRCLPVSLQQHENAAYGSRVIENEQLVFLSVFKPIALECIIALKRG